ncbi:cysteine protease RD19A-like [Arachis stenosperma]|uniref:cysteine protease RD19A-like n=1 Tax=Arachis stenosperma TaxID=217475 RepID=UPI0025AB99EA|nr:cysteine protease RD19A-like [Arachis stenosperma]
MPVIQTLVDGDGLFSLFKPKLSSINLHNAGRGSCCTIQRANLRRAKLDPSAQHGVRKFSDLTPEEFKRHHLGSSQEPGEVLAKLIISARNEAELE